MCDKAYQNSDKWTISIMTGLLFLLVSSPYAYSLSSNIARYLGLDISENSGCPNLAGLMVHAGLFALLLRILMSKGPASEKCTKPFTSKDKWIVSMIGGLLFLLISSPFLYEAIDSLTSLAGIRIASSDGCPNLRGLLLHSAVFAVIVRLLMR